MSRIEPTVLCGQLSALVGGVVEDRRRQRQEGSGVGELHADGGGCDVIRSALQQIHGPVDLAFRIADVGEWFVA